MARDISILYHLLITRELLESLNVPGIFPGHAHTTSNHKVDIDIYIYIVMYVCMCRKTITYFDTVMEGINYCCQ